MTIEPRDFLGKYVIRAVERFEEPVYTELVNSVLGGPPEWERLLTEEERQRHAVLKGQWKSPLSLRIGVFLEEELVGLTFGWQLDQEAFYMGISLVRPEHRRQGIYSELLRTVLSATRAAGFQTVQSHHRATNNPVIIAKLQVGFVISGLEFSGEMGVLARLTYFHGPERRKLMDARAGLTRPTGMIRELFF